MNMKKIKEFIAMVIVIGFITIPSGIWDRVQSKIKHQEEFEECMEIHKMRQEMNTNE